MSLATPTPNADTASLEIPDQALPPLPPHWVSLPAAFLTSARENWKKLAVVDSLGTKMTYGDTLIRALVFSRLLARKLGPEQYVGLLVPPGGPALLANLAITFLGKTAVNLNYSASKPVIDSSIKQCGIKQILTSKRVIDKLGYQPEGESILLEDLAKTVTTFDKIWSASMAKLAPRSLLALVRTGFGSQLTATATIIFTSGSTGDPKGVILSHRNILSNVYQIDRAFNLLPNEIVMGILPLFHAFGYTVSIWTVLLLGKQVVFHHSPLDYRTIPELIEKHKATMIVSSPTFMRSYCECAKPGQLSSLVHVLVGSEKLPSETAVLIKEKVGREPLEGFGATELSPVVAINTPQEKTTRDGRKVPGNRLGMTGSPLPGTAIKTTLFDSDMNDLAEGRDLERGEIGVIWVKGPQVMEGYLNRPEATAKVIKNGWYCTGDLGFIDPDGFLKITGRAARFAKIAGEMVPLDGVEEAIQKSGEVCPETIAVTSIPDLKRGERLVALYTDMGKSVEDVCQRLNAGDSPKLWIPSPRDFIKVDEIPLAGVGKRDLTKLKAIAIEHLGS